MIGRWGRALVAAILCLSALTGCAEIDRRGGIIAEIEDNVLFVAQTKSHQLFRSYMLVGVLMAAARQAGHNDADKVAVVANLQSALSVAFEAYNCLYNGEGLKLEIEKISKEDASEYKLTGTDDAIWFQAPATCQFFDEKMARLDYALYRLSLSALFNAQTGIQLSSIRDKLVGEIPVLSASAKAAIFATKAVNQATNVVDDLLNLSFSSLGPLVTLLPLYRDSLEMNMWVIVDSLTRACANPQPNNFAIPTADEAPALDKMTTCQKKTYALSILNSGNGSLPLWRNFVRHMNYASPDIEAYDPHFVLVTRFIWRSCKNLYSSFNCGMMVDTAYKYAKSQSLRIAVSIPAVTDREALERLYSVERQLPSRFATQPVRSKPEVGAAPPTNPLGGRDDQTGSIPRSAAPAR